MKTAASALGLVVAMALAAPATAQEWIVGAYGARFSTGAVEDMTGVVVEYHGSPRHHFAGLDVGYGIATSLDNLENFWIGAGVVMDYDLGGNWFIEASFMPGYYRNGTPETDLGLALEFRTLFGVGYRFSETAALSLAIDHRSNGGLGDINPGLDAVGLRFHRAF